MKLPACSTTHTHLTFTGACHTYNVDRIMREYPIQFKEKGFSKRGFSGENLNLTVWTKIGEEKVHRIELVHDVIKKPHALIFEDNKSVKYYAVDEGEDKIGRYPTEILKINGSIPKDSIIKEFIKVREGLPEDLAELVLKKLEGIEP